MLPTLAKLFLAESLGYVVSFECCREKWHTMWLRVQGQRVGNTGV